MGFLLPVFSNKAWLLLTLYAMLCLCENANACSVVVTGRREVKVWCDMIAD